MEIDGARYVSPDEIVSRLRMDTAASLFDDVGPLEKRVRQHPSVRDVRIERKLPGTLIVRITENLPVAFVQAASGLVAVDATGRSLPVDPATADVDLPVLAVRDTLTLRVLGEVREQGAGALRTNRRSAPPAARWFVLPAVPLDRDSRRISHTTCSLPATSPWIVCPISFPSNRIWRAESSRATELDLRFRDQVIARVP